MFSKEYLHILIRRPVTTFPIEHGICDELYLYVHLEVLRGLGGVCEWPHHRSARAPTHARTHSHPLSVPLDARDF
jgi:hypothetical protein